MTASLKRPSAPVLTKKLIIDLQEWVVKYVTEDSWNKALIRRRQRVYKKKHSKHQIDISADVLKLIHTVKGLEGAKTIDGSILLMAEHYLKTHDWPQT